ncbi:hypothetical protein M501DRAFT_264626 [Patellaria atrata CBS 101060]|uniref:Uncharacterized protein n=1 Tax=Patellaria atrata CBS 101060 TaxID=1346257 RepID=A0A9P4S5A4_9PEZI|nr:hypothetical protein M501DRAFT_264626 [Patellaria atrata CBS 101060]
MCTLGTVCQCFLAFFENCSGHCCVVLLQNYNQDKLLELPNSTSQLMDSVISGTPKALRPWDIRGKGVLLNECQNATSVSLWFVTYWVFSATWALIFGSDDLMRLICKKRKVDKDTTDTMKFWNIAGSLVFRITTAIVTAVILRNDSVKPKTSLTLLIISWLLQPGPGVAVTLISYISRHQYARSARYFLNYEIVFDYLKVLAYAYLVHHTRSVDLELLLLDKRQLKGFRAVKYGAIAGLVVWLLSVLGGHVLFLEASLRSSRIVISIPNIILGFTIWIGAMLWEPDLFCPSDKAVKDVTVWWAMFTVVESLWRMLFFAPKIGRADPRN